MIIPLGQTRDTQSLVEIEKTDTGIAQKPLLPVRFVPLLHVGLDCSAAPALTLAKSFR